MTLIELQEKLNTMKIPQNFYSLDGGLPNEAYCIGYNKGKWEVYYSERGNKTDLKKFQSENEACNFFYISFTKLMKQMDFL
ncbi:hypothetical protein [Alkalihalobacillus sp. AL-G]|uniref:hypothetical protein n=1 Tax=Alkalihalobacillus sp. AL-G TaxID=2926399 RepID=UPI0027295274|nr:hypothetical protein [Alkalihalobacillus sp. AL-G]WLD94527.1 hypothetical protein MOJ78_06480 [Alkalihalobacillus sp. AL-G]